jgi:pimeloyl-ACP methyl ester carboxylesterase
MSLRKFLAVAVFVCVSLHAQNLPSALTTDPAPDKANPAAMVTFTIPSHGEQMNAIAYVASGAGPHPIVILLHGFPGNEKNLDVAQAIRRADWDVLYFNYRGSWGTPGAFSFTHAIEDTDSAIAWLRDPANAKKLRSDPKNIVLVGHSMGGMIATVAGAHDPAVRAVGLISAANMAGRNLAVVKAGRQEAAIPQIAAGLRATGVAPLAGCTPESLARDLLANAAAWNIPDLASGLASRPMLIVTSDDGLAPPLDALATNLRNLKDTRVTTLHLATDHVYSDQRIALQTAVLNWLGTLPVN